MSVFAHMRFSIRVGLVSRRQKMLDQPRIVRCASKKNVTTYVVKGKRGNWTIRAERWDYDAEIRPSGQ